MARDTGADRHPQAKKLASDVGSLVENLIGNVIEHRHEAQVLQPAEKPQAYVWYQVPLRDGLSGDGSEYHLYLRKGSLNRLCVFLSGGGVAWNEFTAARPVNGARTASGEPNFYWNNLRPFTQIMNINVGITQNDRQNPFYDWNFLVIPYTTGDFHVGDRDFPYTDVTGKPAVLHFHGAKNVRAALAMGKHYFPEAQKLLLAGDSAGAFAVPAHAGEIADEWYPDCRDITLFSDSGQLLTPDWKRIARDVWGAPRKIWAPLNTRNITLDWYRSLLSTHPGRFRLLYASSTHDYLLSTFYNDMTNRVYKTDAAVRDAYFRQLKTMVKGLVRLDPSFSFFINSWENPLFTKAQRGTVHTAVRQPYFYVDNHAKPGTLEGRRCVSGVTMAQWLHDAADGNCYDVGTGLLEEG